MYKIKMILSFIKINCILKIEYLMPAIIMLKLLYFRKELGLNLFDDTSILANLSSVLIIAAIIHLFSGRFKLLSLILTNFMLTLLLLSNIIYHRYSMDVISIPLLIQASQLKSVQDSVFQLIKAKDLLWLMDIPFIVFIIKCCKNKTEDGSSFRFRIAVVLLLIGSIGINYTFSRVNEENPLLLQTIWYREAVVNDIGILSYHMLDAKEYLTTKYQGKKDFLSDESEAIINWLKTNQDSKGYLQGAAKGKNVIVIQVEALTDFVINRKLNGQEITPNLNKLAQNSVYFNNFYSQTCGGNTSDAEFLANVSLYPARRGAAFFRFSSNQYDSTSKILSSLGYKSYVFHAYKPNFWNREVMYGTLGYENFFDQRDFVIDDQVGLGLSDKSFFRQSLEKIKTLKEPYYLSFITLSSHYPYDFNVPDDQFEIGEHKGNVLGNYLRMIHYTDQAIGEFIGLLNESGILQNSLLVIYGDHGAIPHEDKDLLYEFLDWEDKGQPTWVQTSKVPLIIRFPDGAVKGVNSTLGGQIDIKPTLLNLMGINSSLSMGQDLFNKSNQSLIFPSLNFIEGDKFYSEGVEYSLRTGEKSSAENFPELYASYKNTLDISRQILINDYMDELNKNLEH